MLGPAGLDFTIVDCEHGAFGIEMAVRASSSRSQIVRRPQWS